MPFGPRASSMHMLRVANAITSILASKGIRAHLDDLVVVARTQDEAHQAYEVAKELFKELGLPEELNKSQPPAQTITWLGVTIDPVAMTISMPPAKVRDTLKDITAVTAKKTINKRSLQSVLGKILHISKCVSPARLFLARLLEALRAAKGFHMKVNNDMRKDFAWFQEFLPTWNGVSIINTGHAAREIVADACPRGLGAADGDRCYSITTPTQLLGRHISALEATNVLLATATFVTEQDRGRVIRIRCDNSAAVQAFTTG